MAATGTSDVRTALDRFLLTAYEHAETTAHASALPTDEIAKQLAIAPPLAEKIATFLEAEGLLDYDNQAVDITIKGMLRAEALLNPRSAKAATADSDA